MKDQQRIYHIKSSVFIFTLLVGFIGMLCMPRVTFAQETTSRLYINTGGGSQVVRESNNEDVLITKDYLNSTRVLSEGEQIEQSSYYPYGEGYSEGLTFGDREIGTDKLFTGHRKLDGLSVYHAGARFYSPRVGQFIQADPVEGPNRYAYVAGNPISLIDPSGYGPALPSQDELEQWKLENRNRFPNELEYNYEFLDSIGVGHSIDRFEGLELEYLASYYIQRNPYNPTSERKEFLEYLSRDIYESSAYNKYAVENLDFIGQANSAIPFYKKKINESSGIQRSMFQFELEDIYEQKLQYQSAYTKSVQDLSLGEKISQNLAICHEFCDFTAYVLAKSGIPNAPGLSQDLSHAFGLVQIGDTAHVYDTTWSGYVTTFYEDRTGQNQWGRSYENYTFFPLWGNEFSFNLNRMVNTQSVPATNNQ